MLTHQCQQKYSRYLTLMAISNLVFAFLVLATLTTCDVSVREITGVTSDQLLFAGNISAGSSSSLYFLFYGIQGVTDRSKLASSPTIVVLGSPKASSQYLNFAGLGPLSLAANMSLIKNPNTASAYANLMFLDYPGTGFSFVSDTKDLPDNYATLANQTSYALSQFAAQVDFGKGRMILLGESSWIRTIPFYQSIQNLAGVVSLAPWPELYAIGKYYGVAGVDLKIFGNTERTSIETTFGQCYTNLRNGKYKEAHECYDGVLNFVETKTNNHNLYNINLNQSLVQHFALVQYYLTLSSSVSLFSAPSNLLFEQQTNILHASTYVDEAKNYTLNISYFMRDNLDVKFLFLCGNQDYISYSKAVLNWTVNELNFVEIANFSKASFTDLTINDTVVGRTKAVTQVQYTEVYDSGHYLWQDKPAVVNAVLAQWVGRIKKANQDYKVNTDYKASLRKQQQIVI